MSSRNQVLRLDIKIADIQNGAVCGFAKIVRLNFGDLSLGAHSKVTTRCKRFFRQLDNVGRQLKYAVTHSLNDTASKEVIAEEEGFSHPEVVNPLWQLSVQQKRYGHRRSG